eukprot:CAMPEP_0202686254 /NCGR_PEP_ID=MMETSP1385-20130828/2062_1 /ASSEMBLY_ACC=CAM_ASM_000861 /TAXON_ID=933848 /ORGANISM="Elphidium margaritaceum" /LENGTH=318 /DNA_ID=CAMNT_0049340789 /DNA_START=111 /DNA_END=1067 /DNA_ORIENTATION=-
MASFGMMNQAYFVGKNILIDWINNFLEINIDKVEECANGAIYCNLWDALHPGTIPMSRVDFTVKHEYDYMKNWKLVQTGFQKAGVEKLIPVQRLIKARYQDNLEFLQWMYKYARDTYNGDPDEPTYDALGRRGKSKGGKEYRGSNQGGSRPRNRGKENNRASRSTAPAQALPRPVSAANRNQYRTGTQSQRGSVSVGNNAASIAELEELRNENKRLSDSRDALQRSLTAIQAEHEELSNVAKDIETERDFYFNKVVSIEQILKQEEDQSMPLLKGVYEILYQTEQSGGDGSQPPPPQEPSACNDAQNLNQDIGNMQMG